MILHLLYSKYGDIMSELHSEKEMINMQIRRKFGHRENSFSKLAKGRFEE